MEQVDLFREDYEIVVVKKPLVRSLERAYVRVMLWFVAIVCFFISAKRFTMGLTRYQVKHSA